jgi:hypothetical protein
VAALGISIWTTDDCSRVVGNSEVISEMLGLTDGSWGRLGCDDHPGFRQVALIDAESGELNERRLAHREEAEPLPRISERPQSACQRQ